MKWIYDWTLEELCMVSVVALQREGEGGVRVHHAWRAGLYLAT